MWWTKPMVGTLGYVDVCRVCSVLLFLVFSCSFSLIGIWNLFFWISVTRDWEREPFNRSLSSSFIPNSLRTTIHTADHHHSSLIFTAGNQTYLLRHSNLETANHRLNHTESNHNAPYRRNISREDEREGREDEQYHCCKSKQLFQNRISNHCHFYQKVRWLMIGQTNLKLSISTFLQHYS